jgi:hypothetical protein
VICVDIKSNMPEITVCSFSYKTGEPAANFFLDVRFLPDPRCIDECNPRLSGMHPVVEEYIRQNFAFQPFFTSLTDKVQRIIQDFSDRGERKLSLAFGCTAGKHRSVFVAEMLYAWLRERSGQVRILHRDIGLDGASPTSSVEHGFRMENLDMLHARVSGPIEHYTYQPENQSIVLCDVHEARRISVSTCTPIMLNTGLKKLQELRERRAISRDSMDSMPREALGLSQLKRLWTDDQELSSSCNNEASWLGRHKSW